MSTARRSIRLVGQGHPSNWLILVVRRLGLEPRALALKGELSSSANTTHPNNTQTYGLPPPTQLGLLWGLLEPVHGQNTDSHLDTFP